MIIAQEITKLKLERKKLIGKKVVLVPTMGALHEGHLALVKYAKEIADFVIVSIFVNKTQFNDLSDYEKYPRQEESDLDKLKNAGVDLVFLPKSQEIFADDFSFKIIPTKITDCLCGSSRVGHFDGVALIVTKLFNLVQPNIAIFGQKDFQQLTLIKRMVRDLNFDIEIFAHPTLREQNGLAMSSRNQRLSESGKEKASNIFRVLTEIKNKIKNSEEKIDSLIEEKTQELISLGFEKIDYLEVRNSEDLKLVTEFNNTEKARIFVAAYLEGIRLIDNLEL
ncbi:MAG: pantoate--beta-alanine ligase [Pelagibacterales bacterium]|nr:pantoate--beta-alanine ligase [Pelagibacterales bacterium]